MKKNYLLYLLLALYIITFYLYLRVAHSAITHRSTIFIEARYLLIPLTAVLTLLVLGFVVKQTIEKFPYSIFIILLTPVFFIFAAPLFVKSHFLLLILSACIISIVLCLISKQKNKERIRFAVIMFLSLVLFTIAAAWMMYFLSP